MSRHILKTAILAAIAATSCTAPDGVANETQETQETPPPPVPSKEKRTLPTPSRNPSVQSLVEIATADLAGRLEKQKIGAAEIKTLQAEQVMWRSSALGCPQPDRGYLMALAPGILIRLSVAGRVYEYHSSLKGPPFLCEPPGRIESPAPRDSSRDLT